MSERTALVLGGHGQVGRELAAVFADAGWHVVDPGRSELDITMRHDVAEAVAALRPRAVINAAALTDVDGCEQDRDRAWHVNALAVRHVAEACAAVDAHLCHISTDHVFDGSKQGPYSEWDRPAPLSIYGLTKLAGEKEAGNTATIVRTSWVCGRHGRNSVKTILGLASDPDQTLAFVTDQIGCLTVAADLARLIHRLVEDRRTGLHHVTGQGALSWHEIARRVLAAAGHDPDRVRPTTTAELVPRRPAPRPANSVLDNAVLRLEGLPLLPHVDEALPALVRSLEP